MSHWRPEETTARFVELETKRLSPHCLRVALHLSVVSESDPQHVLRSQADPKGTDGDFKSDQLFRTHFSIFPSNAGRLMTRGAPEAVRASLVLYIDIGPYLAGKCRKRWQHCVDGRENVITMITNS